MTNYIVNPNTPQAESFEQVILGDTSGDPITSSNPLPVTIPASSTYSKPITATVYVANTAATSGGGTYAVNDTIIANTIFDESTTPPTRTTYWFNATQNYAFTSAPNITDIDAFSTDVETSMGRPADTAVTNPASSGSQIALLKGILTGVNTFDAAILPFYPASATNTQTISVTTVSAGITFSGGDITAPSVRVFNSGTYPVFIRWGVGAQTAVATTDLSIAPGSVEVFYKGTTATGFAAITASGTATLYVTPGSGE